MIRYINRKSGKNIETVDQLSDEGYGYYNRTDYRKELARLLTEYRLSDSSATYYVSQRPTKDWNS